MKLTPSLGMNPLGPSLPIQRSGLPRRIQARLQDIISYGASYAQRFPRFLHRRNRPGGETEGEINDLLSGYPHNHNYRIWNRTLVPNLRLFERWRRVSSLYPSKLESFADIGCCRGFYVLDAALRGNARVAVGVDVHAPFIEISRNARSLLGLPGVNFHLADLEALAANPAAFGGPFQTVILLGTYHYLYWGSDLSSKAYGDHGRILEMLRRITTDRLILSGRLEVDRLPGYLRRASLGRPEREHYNLPDFLKAAGAHFAVKVGCTLWRDPLFLLRLR